MEFYLRKISHKLTILFSNFYFTFNVSSAHFARITNPTMHCCSIVHRNPWERRFKRNSEYHFSAAFLLFNLIFVRKIGRDLILELMGKASPFFWITWKRNFFTETHLDIFEIGISLLKLILTYWCYSYFF